MSQKKLQSGQKSFKKGSIEINMSTLSSAQKQMCLKLLASSNINFEEDKNENVFQAELRIDPAKMTEQITTQKKQAQQPKVSPIKKRQNPSKLIQAKQNIGISGNKKQLKQAQKPITIKSKQVNHAIYTNSRKPLGKTIKIHNLTEIQKLHPYIQLYIYPKKMSFQSLVELIQEIYQLYWTVQIQGKMNPKTKRDTNRNEDSENKIKTQYALNDKSKSKVKQTAKDSNNNADETTNNRLKTSEVGQTFSHWVYQKFIQQNRQRQIKAEQLLVNMIESLNHFSFKHLGVQIFMNFLSGSYSLDALNYFLVIRALLEQLTGEKIIQRVSSYGSKAGVTYKMRLNPYSKQIQQGRVYDFLQVCFQGSKQQSLVDDIFQQMTSHMFFDDKKRKNFIHYFDMVNILLKQFMKVQPTNTTTNLQLSMTQTHDHLSFNQLLTYSNIGGDAIEEEKQMELTFQVQQQQPVVAEVENIVEEGFQLENYLPGNVQLEESQLEDYKQEKSQDLKKQEFYEQMINQIYARYKAICTSFAQSQSLQYSQRKSKEILDTLIQAVLKHDKNAWIDMLKTKRISPQRQTQQLHFIQQLQKEYQQIKNSNFISTQFIKKLLTASYLRETIVMESGINSKIL